MRARDIMSSPVYAVRADNTIEDAAAVLATRDITAAPVLDAAGEVIGMVNEGDLLSVRFAADPTAHLRRSTDDEGTVRPSRVGDVMSTRVVSARPDDDIADIARMMLVRGVHSVPVIDDGDLVGIVSRRDIMRAIVRTDEVLRNEVQDRLDEYAGGVRRWTVTVSRGNVTVDGPFNNDTERHDVAILARTVPGVAAARIVQHA
jgi:CBS domain-containing protein